VGTGLDVKIPKIMVFIKPWDESVFENFMVFMQTCKTLMEEYELPIDFYAAFELVDEFKKAKDLKKKYGLDDSDLNGVGKLTREFQMSVNFIITLGGDGTILWASKQFSCFYVPPLITFDQGSLGFMCNFVFSDHPEIIRNLFEQMTDKESNKLGLDSRMRLKVSMGEGGNNVRQIFRGENLKTSSELILDEFHVLNEVMIDRGPSPVQVQLDLYIDGNKFTSINGDGIIISTPTGSTAYNLSAGGSIVQANTPCICLTPLAPHSLSFRPLILPASAVIQLKKPVDGRSQAWVSLDGATRFRLQEGESIEVQGSVHPLQMVTLKNDNLTDLWAQRLRKHFSWNIRESNKPLQKRKQENPSDAGLYSYK